MIFLVVSANLTLSLVEATEAYSGAAVVLRGPDNFSSISYVDPAKLTPILIDNADII